MADDWVGLADAIAALRRELTTAMTAGKDSALRFGLGPVEMEFLLEIRREANDKAREGGAEAPVRFGVVTTGAKDSVTRGSTHRVKLSLQPQDQRGRRGEISDTEDITDTE
jgi:hypothetical protein